MSQTLTPALPETFPTLQVVPDWQVSDEEIAHFFDEIKATKQQTSFMPNLNLLGEKQYQNGYTELYGYVDEAGYGRAGVVGIPRKPVTDVPVMFTTAWFTSTEGHNLHTGLKFLDNGVPFIISGAEGSYRPPLFSMRPPKEGINLTNSAASLLAFAGQVASEHKYILHSTDREVIGESRGGMVAMGVLALAEAYDQKITMADLTAPCFPRGFSREDLFSFKDQLVAEPRTIFGLAGKLAMRLALHYPQTLDLNPISLAHQVAIAPALFSGEAGDLGRLIEGDPIVHVTCFDDDYASMPDEWADVLDVTETESGNTRITLLKGSHLTIADPQTLQYILARNKALRLLDTHPSQRPSGQAVFDYAHQLVPEEFRLSA